MEKALIAIVGFTHFLLGLTTLSAQEMGSADDPEIRINDFLSGGIANGFSGAILVARDGKIVINKGYGMADKARSIPNTPTTVFDVGSVTKQFTATAVLKLSQSGKLKVTDSLSTFFDDVPNDKADITVHQLLTHSAGLTDTIGRDFDQISTELYFSTLFATELIHSPGSRYSYSNAGYSVLARIIELVSDQEYEQFLNENLFDPAGMTHTGYLIPDWTEDSLARGYARSTFDRGSMVTRYQEDRKVSWNLKGNGGINSTHEDMHKWYVALKQNEFFTRSKFEEMTKPHIERTSDLGYSHYGYGWGIEFSDGRTRKIAHNGSNGLFSHSFIWSLEEDVAIIYSTNAGSVAVERLGHEVDKTISNVEYLAKPIKKDIYLFVLDFVETNSPVQSDELFAMIKENYFSDFQNSDVLNKLGYDILEIGNNVEWAIELFKLNVRLFENEANVWDSLGDGYLANDQSKEAIESFARAVELGSEGTQEKLEELLK